METVLSIISSPPEFGWFIVLKVVLTIVSLLSIAGIIFFALNSSWAKLLFLQDASEFTRSRPYGVRKIIKAWNKIRGRLETGLESEYKLAVIEADNMLNDTLKRMGFAGETLLEKLKNLTSATLSNIEDIKASHQIRNNIVHDPDYKLTLDDSRKILDVYEKAFRNLDAF